MPVKSPIDHQDLTLSIVVKINGDTINKDYSLVAVNTTSQLNKIPYAILNFSLSVPLDGSLPQSDDEVFEIGNQIEILAGYGEEETISIFAGLITKQSLSMNGDGTLMLRLTCKHQAVAMTYYRKDAEFSCLRDMSIIQQIAQSYALDAKVDNSNIVYETIFQKGTNDWDFLLSRAEFNGFLVNCINGNTLHIGKPDVSATPVLGLEMGVSIIDFKAELDGQYQMLAIEAKAWDSDNQELVTSIAEEPLLNAQGDISAQQLATRLGKQKQTIFSGAALGEAELQVWADSSLLRMRLAALRGEVRFQGSGLVNPGQLISLAGLGARYNGNAFVSSVTHQIESGNWFTMVEFGLSQTAEVARTGINLTNTTGQQSGFTGLQIATVKNLSGDPQSQFRVQLILNAATTSQDGIWARMGNFYATNGAGITFLPEIGDEVIVGFLDGDSNCPIVLGSLYSSFKTPAYTATNDNNIKSIITKAKLKIVFDDDKKTLNLSTPGGNTFILDDENKQVSIHDQNGNVITLDPNGINLTSAKNINLVASGDIKLDAKGRVDINAAKEADITAMDIRHSAKVSFTAKAIATAELRSEALTMVNGSMVTIN